MHKGSRGEVRKLSTYLSNPTSAHKVPENVKRQNNEALGLHQTADRLPLYVEKIALFKCDQLSGKMTDRLG